VRVHRDCVFPREKPLFLFSRRDRRGNAVARAANFRRPDAAAAPAAPGKFFCKMVDIPKMHD